jgi:hypothetical protein
MAVSAADFQYIFIVDDLSPTAGIFHRPMKPGSILIAIFLKSPVLYSFSVNLAVAGPWDSF